MKTNSFLNRHWDAEREEAPFTVSVGRASSRAGSSVASPHPNGATAAERYATLSRRHFLRGLGACLALPAFESLRPLGVRAEDLKAATPAGVSSSGAPVRMAFVYFPNGAIQDTWWPTGEGKEFELNKTMQPLEKIKDRLQVISGLDCKGATPGPDGAGDHARASGSFLTGVRVKKTAGADIHAGISIDQVAANQIGHLTRFPSLELTCDYVRKSGSCDSGYSCAYQYNLAWRSHNQPLAPEPNPRLVFERLFGGGAHGERNKSLQRRQQEQRSILDFVLDDARTLQRQLAARDKQKLDDYLESVRAVEQRIQRAEQFGAAPDPAIETPAGIPGSFGEYVQIMFDMLVLAFQTDSTRVATFLLALSEHDRPPGHERCGAPRRFHGASRSDLIGRQGRARHSVRAATVQQSPERRARSDAPCRVAKLICHST